VSAPRILFAGDSSLVVQFENRIDPAVNARVADLARIVLDANIDGVRDIVPTFRSVAVYYDPVGTDIDELSDFLEEAANRAKGEAAMAAGEPIRVPVRYGGEDGPDLAAVAAFAGMTPDAVIAVHTGCEYRVFMLGFVPGFAYMASVDDRIAMPRLDSPRTRVPAGSVGIAGSQTGIYPSETPGGWRLIGRTTLKPFDLAAHHPCRFKTGDRVRFYDDWVGA
jgi:KipI family sensor histidine kinase inhibitor